MLNRSKFYVSFSVINRPLLTGHRSKYYSYEMQFLNLSPRINCYKINTFILYMVYYNLYMNEYLKLAMSSQNYKDKLKAHHNGFSL